MKSPSHHLLTVALALVLAAVPCAAVAQEVVQPLPGTTDADRLADTMRQLATNPRNVDALIRAGELSIAGGDLSGAAALFARAEKVDLRNGRVKAGMASILVRSERPGEALRYFAQAESYGLDSRNFAADRGFAYDLIGQQDRAQRDYRVALRDAVDDETVRRYALSLGISGKQELALQQLAPLVQKSDRGAWRARAFIMAMNGDIAGAEKIATTMMPGAIGQGLLPFFTRLPTLTAADRAFAVHFGEVHSTPDRLADARMTPALPALGPDATAPVMVAAVQPVTVPTAQAKGRKRDRNVRPGRTEMATTVPTRVTAPMQMVQAVPPQETSPQVLAQATPVRVVPQVVRTPQPTYRSPVVVAQALPVPVPTIAPAPNTATPRAGFAAPVPQTNALPATLATQMAILPNGTASSSSVTRAANSAVPQTTVASTTMVPSTMPAPAGTVVRSVTPLPSATAPVREIVATPLPTPGFSGTTPAAGVVAAAQPPAPSRAVSASEDSILARIIAGLSIPASELDVAPMHPAPIVASGATQAAVPVSDDAERVLAEAKAKTERDAAAKAIAAEKLAADKKAVIDRKAAARKAIADKKALADKKAAAAEKLAADKAAAEEKRIARANPERIWVQVSTGATEGDLPKAWKSAKAKAPTVFGARGGWTTPWKATNRVLAGPFKTDAEARTFVNQLAKEGVSTFSFTSDAGQVITKLPPK